MSELIFRLTAGAVLPQFCTAEKSARDFAFVTHIDSHGMMVTSVSENGISFEPSADLCTDTVYGKLVTLGTADRRTDGVVCAVPLHLTSRRDALKIPDCGDMFISVGNPDVQESMADSDDRISSESGVNSACGVNPDCCADGKHPGISPEIISQ